METNALITLSCARACAKDEVRERERKRERRLFHAYEARDSFIRVTRAADVDDDFLSRISSMSKYSFNCASIARLDYCISISTFEILFDFAG